MPPVDFTWEREWRLQTDVLPLMQNDVVIVLPNEGWEERLGVRIEQHLVCLQPISLRCPHGARRDWPFHAASDANVSFSK